ncbi:MAG: CDP-alcohol phosphatidyltransferase family protein [Planctomycetaceae bacterium]|nr:CDP-alcohol phosphatidyltransferase family protein [Planctomycetaceae bacterium]
MSKRVSHSLLDPYVTLPLKARYEWFRIPRWLPPEALVLMGHCGAIVAAFGLAWSTRSVWGGLVAAAGIAANHLCDVLDGTHARRTGQCRNGGELLDHFTDPLSFAYYLCGIAVACGRLDLGLAAVICLFATAVLTNIRAKLVGEFTLAPVGPTEFKTLLVAGSLALSAAMAGWFPTGNPAPFLATGFTGLVAFGIIQLVVQLVRAVCEVNAKGKPADTTEWITVRAEDTGNRPNSRHNAA